MSQTVIDLYERHAKAWDEDRGRRLIEKPWLERFTASLRPGAAILDIGCGAGEPIARYLIEEDYSVVGIDTSPSLIALAEARFPTATWRVMDMRDLDLGQRFDAILAWHSFFHLTAADQRLMFARFAAHSQEGTMLMFTSGPEAGEAIGEYRGEPLYHASLSSDEYRQLLNQNAFQVVAHEARDPGCGDATIWLARRT